MKKTILPIAMAITLAAIMATGCTFIDTIAGSGNLVELDLAYAGFTELEVDAPYEITLIHGDEYNVTVMVDDNLVDNIESGMSGQVLNLDLSPYYNYSNVSLKAVITMPTLEGLALSSASTVTVIDSASFPSVTDFSVSVTDASQLLISSIVANTLSVTVDDAGRATIGAVTSTTLATVDDAASLQLNGTAFDLRLDVSDASNADLSDYQVDGAAVSVTGASEGWVNVNGVLDADITGASALYYRGAVSLGFLNIEGASSFAVF